MDFPTPEQAQALYVKSHEAEIVAFLDECKVAILNAGGACTFGYKTDLSGVLMNAASARLAHSGWSVAFKPAAHYDDKPIAIVTEAIKTSNYWKDR